MAVDHVARAMAMDAGGGTAPVDVYTKAETDELLGQKADKSEVTESVTAAVAQIVADAPEDFNTLQEMSDWIASHEDSAAAMNTAILQNSADIDAVETQQTEQAEVINIAAEGVAMNRSTLGYQAKNLLKNMAKSQTINGVTFTVNEDGSVTIHGTNTDTEKTAYITLNSHIKTVYGQKYTASIATDQISGVYMSIFDSQWVGAGRCNPKITFTENKNDGRNIRLSVEAGAVVENVTVYPMLRYAEISNDTYEPYKPSVQEQIEGTMQKAAINQSTLGYQRKNLLMNNCKTTTKNGVTATVNDDGSITFTGSNTGSDFVLYWNIQTGAADSAAEQYTGNKKWIPNGKYKVSGGHDGVTVQVRWSENNALGSDTGLVASSKGSEPVFTVTDAHKYVWSRIFIAAGADFSTPVTVYPMIRPADITDYTYEPYKPSVQEQIDALISRISALESSQTDMVTSKNMSDEIITMNVEDEKHERTENLEQTD